MVTMMFRNKNKVGFMLGHKIFFQSFKRYGKWMFLMILLINLAFAFTLYLYAKDQYTFPMRPGISGWEGLDSHEAKVKATQIPPERLASMSTESLIETCLSYPLLGDIFAFSTLQQGFERVGSDFNGLKELLNRKDAGRKLLAKYKEVNESAFNENWTDAEKGTLIMRLIFLEMALAQKPIVGNLSLSERSLLMKECLKKYNFKESHPKVFGILSKTSVAFTLANAMDATIKEKTLPDKKWESQEIRELTVDPDFVAFVNTSSLRNPVLLRRIKESAGRLIGD